MIKDIPKTYAELVVVLVRKVLGSNNDDFDITVTDFL